MKNRPALNTKISIPDFKDFYWRKDELIEFCRSQNLDKRSGKIEITNRIEKFLITGEYESYQDKKSPISRFKWNTEKLTIDTEITDNYKNTENVRAFFKNQIGDKFKFHVKFMNWMKTAQGMTLANAIEQWILITNEMRRDRPPKQIAPQFEYNTYIRDFLKDNPGNTLQDAVNSWKVKKSAPGDNKYTQSDLR